MDEEEPLKGGDDIEPTRVPLTGPNVRSTFDVPPRPDALLALRQSIRRHLRGAPPPPERPDPPKTA
jgi:hypothetical protein